MRAGVAAKCAAPRTVWFMVTSCRGSTNKKGWYCMRPSAISVLEGGALGRRGSSMRRGIIATCPLSSTARMFLVEIPCAVTVAPRDLIAFGAMRVRCITTGDLALRLENEGSCKGTLNGLRSYGPIMPSYRLSTPISVRIALLLKYAYTTQFSDTTSPAEPPFPGLAVADAWCTRCRTLPATVSTRLTRTSPPPEQSTAHKWLLLYLRSNESSPKICAGELTTSDLAG
mmetsp:Transcript_19791/g.44864  ORF Transcript_19791/g.44864 Transcript_19791/m.44864 type:complete len:228 (-) Transcript_19791:351-1034(-)